MVGNRSMHTEAVEGLRAMTCQNLEVVYDKQLGTVGSLEG